MSGVADDDSTSCFLSSVRDFAAYWSSPTYQHDRIGWAPSSAFCSAPGLNQSLEWSRIKGAERDLMLAAVASTRLVCSSCKASRRQFQIRGGSALRM